MKKLLMLTLCFISAIVVSAQEEDPDEIKKKLGIILKEPFHPDVYIDGKKYPYDIVNLIDTDKIESISVIKNVNQLKKIDSLERDYSKYGDAPNGLILIETNKPGVEIRSRDRSKDPLIVVDGKVMDKLTLKEIDPDKIKYFNFLRDEKAIKEYNAPNGVLIIKMKK